MNTTRACVSVAMTASPIPRNTTRSQSLCSRSSDSAAWPRNFARQGVDTLVQRPEAGDRNRLRLQPYQQAGRMFALGGDPGQLAAARLKVSALQHQPGRAEVCAARALAQHGGQDVGGVAAKGLKGLADHFLGRHAQPLSGAALEVQQPPLQVEQQKWLTASSRR